MSRVRVVVCGTNYGRSYLQAIQLRPSAYELIGILARGSTRSRRIARQYGVPLYRTVEEVPPGVDVACAALGASASSVVIRLLERGIHVLCEHPQKAALVKTALRVARRRQICFHINGHFADLEAAQALIRHSRLLQRSAMPEFFDVMATDRSLYAALDILRRILDRFVPFRFEVSSRRLPFTVIQGLLGGARTTFQVQSSRQARGKLLPDGDPRYLTDIRIAVGFPIGVLSLLSLAGPVLWNSNYRRSGAVGPLWASVYGGKVLSSERFLDQRIQANLRAITSLARNARQRTLPPEQTEDHLLEVSRGWELLGRMLQA